MAIELSWTPDPSWATPGEHYYTAYREILVLTEDEIPTERLFDESPRNVKGLSLVQQEDETWDDILLNSRELTESRVLYLKARQWPFGRQLYLLHVDEPTSVAGPTAARERGYQLGASHVLLMIPPRNGRGELENVIQAHRDMNVLVDQTGVWCAMRNGQAVAVYEDGPPPTSVLAEELDLPDEELKAYDSGLYQQATDPQSWSLEDQA